MDRRNLISFLCALILITMPGITGAQNPFKAIVLIDGSPFLVDLSTDGSIYKRYQGIPNYFEVSTTDEKIISDLINQGLIEQDDFSVRQRSTAFETFNRQVGEGSNIGADDEMQYISFSLQRAILTREAVNQVRAIADAYQEDRFKLVNINAFHLDTGQTRTLASNRANAIADLLETFGVSPGAIKVNLPVTTEENDLSFVNMSFE